MAVYIYGIYISMDFISGFLKVEGFRCILVMVERFSKYSVFIRAPYECPAEEVKRIFFGNIVKYFGMHADIVSDQCERFIDKFQVELFKIWGIECNISTANHP